mmetsp:Transcript_5616/g.10061  ORF Transcript_5616/g.10061 Transcript_5616/m.10061 type:complete len:90 (-) Transcript_5616:38-307(-)
MHIHTRARTHTHTHTHTQEDSTTQMDFPLPWIPPWMHKHTRYATRTHTTDTRMAYTWTHPAPTQTARTGFSVVALGMLHYPPPPLLPQG